MKITFYGGTKKVSGANYLIEESGIKILVDCGMVQGGYTCEAENYNDFPYDPGSIQAVFVTHAHLDHVGRLPKLYRDGFKGTIYSTAPTKDLANAILLDSEHIIKEDAAHHNHEQLYTTKDVQEVLKFWKTISYYDVIELAPDFAIKFINAGHILGSASIEVLSHKSKVVFSGDLGNTLTEFLPPSDYVHDADVMIVESTYGNIMHQKFSERIAIFEDAIEETVKNKGVLMIPAFAMEKTQELLFDLDTFIQEHRIPAVPVYLDSPLAIKVTDIYKNYTSFLSRKTQERIHSGIEFFDFPNLIKTLTVEESKKINTVPPPKVVIAGAGMSTGGRILHHELRYLPDPNSTILFVGYQVDGSLGRKIRDAENNGDFVEIFGEKVPVRCRAITLNGYSAHPDKAGLLTWLAASHLTLKKAFLVQGEEDAIDSLRQAANDILAIDAEAPEYGESFEI